MQKPYTGNPRDRIGLFILLDAVPEWVEKTFWLKKDASGRYISVGFNQIYQVYKLGEEIDTRQSSFIVVYNGSDYHNQQAQQVLDQLDVLVPDHKTMTIPVQG